MCTLCENCTFNNFGNCDENEPHYMNVFDEDDCKSYQEDEDCGPLDEDMGLDTNDPFDDY